MVGRLGPWVVAAAVAVAALFALFASPRVPAPLGRGSSAPDFELPRISEGAPISLAALRGEVILVNFWATWCKPCEDEMPAMQRLYGALHEQGFQLLAISVDDDREPVVEFSERLGLSFPILFDADKRVAQAYQTYRFPESFLVDRDGRVVERYIGPRDWDAAVYVDRIQRLLRGES
ncbi:MAG TPA: TlpA disulfide reductase family protein [Myxococcota bacterium]